MSPFVVPFAAIALLGWQAPVAPRADVPKPKSSTPQSSAPYALAGIVHDPSAPLEIVERKKPKPSDKSDAVKSIDLTFKGGSGAVVPASLNIPALPGRKPAILILHGMGGGRNQVGWVSTLFNLRGYVTLAIDMAAHGERPKPKGGKVEDITLDDIRNQCAQTVVDLRRAVDLLLQHPEVAPDRLGIAGVSMGGILGSRFFSDDPRVKAAVFLYAGADWGKLMTTTQIAEQTTVLPRGVTDPASINKALADIDPMHSIARAAGRPILLVHGDKDDIVPLACNEILFRAAKEPKERILLPGGHIAEPLRAISLGMTFLDKHLAKK